MNFIPEVPKQASTVIQYFDDVTGKDGWQGQSTGKSEETLKSEVVSSIGRLGGVVTGFQRGTFQTEEYNREGFRINYVIENAEGLFTHGRLDVAALPVKTDRRKSKTFEARKQKSLKMSLYMLRIALDGTWFLQQLSPGYAPLMPWMLGDSNKTITQLWSESSVMNRLLPQGESFIDGEMVE